MKYFVELIYEWLWDEEIEKQRGKKNAKNLLHTSKMK